MSTDRAQKIQPGDLELQPLSEQDLPITERFLTDPAMMEHLGGAQSLDTAPPPPQSLVDAAASGGRGGGRFSRCSWGPGPGLPAAWATGRKHGRASTYMRRVGTCSRRTRDEA